MTTDGANDEVWARTDSGMSAGGPTRARVLGALFLAAIVCYATGTALVSGSGAARVVGVVIVLLNSAAVVGMGAGFYPILSRTSWALAQAYSWARAAEGTLLAAGVTSLALGAPASWNLVAYQIAMLILGTGSQALCLGLLGSTHVPRVLALWGAIGYAALAVGSLADLAGARVGTWMAIPGGLFEVTFAVWLLARGRGRAL